MDRFHGMLTKGLYGENPISDAVVNANHSWGFITIEVGSPFGSPPRDVGSPPRDLGSPLVGSPPFEPQPPVVEPPRGPGGSGGAGRPRPGRRDDDDDYTPPKVGDVDVVIMFKFYKEQQYRKEFKLNTNKDKYKIKFLRITAKYLQPVVNKIYAAPSESFKWIKTRATIMVDKFKFNDNDDNN